MFIADPQNSLIFKQPVLLRIWLVGGAGNSLTSAPYKTNTLKAA